MVDDVEQLIRHTAPHTVAAPVDEIVARGRRRRHRRSAAFVVSLLVAAVTAGAVVAELPRRSVDLELAEQPSPFDDHAQLRPDLLVLSPEVTAPGEVVEMQFPQSTVRGPAFVLERQVPGGWRFVYVLIAVGADAPEGARPTWRVADDQLGVKGIGITGPGPESIEIPDVAEPGAHRVCTANAASNICAELQIVAPGSPPVSQP